VKRKNNRVSLIVPLVSCNMENLCLKRDGKLGYTFRHLTPADAAQIMELQLAYQRVYPKAVVIPAEVYLSPTLSNGGNIICAFDDDGKMAGYTAINENISHQADIPHNVWSIVKVNPALVSPRPLQEALFERSVAKALELVQPYPGHAVNLKFNHDKDEKDAITFLESRGCSRIEGTFHMMCDLPAEVVTVDPPQGILVRDLDQKNEAEVIDYVDGRNESFPFRYLTVENWRHFVRTLLGPSSRIIIALNDGAVIGGVTVSWNEELNKRIGIDMGETDDVFVRTAWRQRGIAACLIGRGLVYFKNTGRRFAHVEVRGANENALKLYQKMGYVTTGETQIFSLNLKVNYKYD
jgi:ribosomal protein S18 acetylase RimI-like enzyme